MLKLYEFPHSHYCEKVRWVLDYKGIDWRAYPVNPGEHLLRFQKKFGSASLPIINDQGYWLQGSQAICLYLEEKYPALPLIPENTELKQACLDSCEAYDLLIGDPLRRVLYDMLKPWPKAVQYYFTHRSGLARQFAFRLSRNYILGKIHKKFVGGEENVAQAHQKLALAVKRLNGTVISQPFLIDDKLTLADISVASLFSILVQPDQHPAPWPKNVVEELADFHDAFMETPAGIWVAEIYKNYRPNVHAGYSQKARIAPNDLFV